MAAHRQRARRTEEADHRERCRHGHLHDRQPPELDLACRHILREPVGERRIDQLLGAFDAVRRRAVRPPREARPLGRAVDHDSAHVEREHHLDDAEEKCHHEDRDQHEVDDGRTVLHPSYHPRVGVSAHLRDR